MSEPKVESRLLLSFASIPPSLSPRRWCQVLVYIRLQSSCNNSLSLSCIDTHHTHPHPATQRDIHQHYRPLTLSSQSPLPFGLFPSPTLSPALRPSCLSSLYISSDFANGFLVAEIFSRYYPKDITMHSFDNGTGMSKRKDNWLQLEKFFLKIGFHVERRVIDSILHCKSDCVVAFIETIYTLLTNKT